MKNLWTLLLLAMVCGCGTDETTAQTIDDPVPAGTPADDPVEPPPGEAADLQVDVRTMTVRVQDASRRPVAGATVRAGEGETSVETATDAEGFAILADIPLDAEIHVVGSNGDDEIAPVRLNFVNESRVVVTVPDAGPPPENLPVGADGRTTAETTVDGVTIFANTLVLENGSAVDTDQLLSAGVLPVSGLPAPLPLAGVLFDPLAALRVSPGNLSFVTAGDFELTFDREFPDGVNFDILWLPDGATEWLVVGSAQAIDEPGPDTRVVATGVVRGGGTYAVAFGLSPSDATTLDLTFVTPDGDPLRHVVVRTGFGHQATTDRDGRVRIRGVPGTNSEDVFAGGTQPVPITIHVEPRHRPAFEFTIPAGEVVLDGTTSLGSTEEMPQNGDVAGRAQFGPGEAPGVLRYDGPSKGETPLSPDGSFFVRDLLPGVYRFLADLAGGTIAVEAEVEANRTSYVPFFRPIGNGDSDLTISTTWTRAGVTSPLAHAALVVRDALGDVHALRTGRDGSIVVRGVELPATVTAHAEAAAPDALQGSICSAQRDVAAPGAFTIDIPCVDFVLRPPPTESRTFTLANADPAAPLRVRFHDAGSGLNGGHGPTLHQLPPGETTLAADLIPGRRYIVTIQELSFSGATSRLAVLDGLPEDGVLDLDAGETPLDGNCRVSATDLLGFETVDVTALLEVDARLVEIQMAVLFTPAPVNVAVPAAALVRVDRQVEGGLCTYTTHAKDGSIDALARTNPELLSPFAFEEVDALEFAGGREIAFDPVELGYCTLSGVPFDPASRVQAWSLDLGPLDEPVGLDAFPYLPDPEDSFRITVEAGLDQGEATCSSFTPFDLVQASK